MINFFKKIKVIKKELSEEEKLKRFNDKGICPDCKNTKFWKGPQGGGSENICCTKCHSAFNYTGIFSAQRISNEWFFFHWHKIVCKLKRK